MSIATSKSYRYLGPSPKPQLQPGDEVRVILEQGPQVVVSCFGTLYVVSAAELGDAKLWKPLRED